MADKGIKGITVTIGADTGPLSKALGDVNAKSRDLQSELRQVERLLKLDPENVTLLAQKQTLLAESTENAAEKLKRLKDVQKQVTEQFKNGDLGGEQFRAYQREVEGAKVALKDTGDEAKSAGKHIDDAGKKAEKSGDNAKSGAQKWEKLGSAVKTAAGFAVKAVAALGTAAAAAGGALVKTTIDGAKYADDLATMAQQTGVATDTLQKFKYASELVDVPLEKVTGSLAKLTKNMLTAQQGSKNTQDAFKTLGVEFQDKDGLRDSEEVFFELAKALSEVENETQRDALAMQLFGKSANELAGIIDDGGENLRAYGEEAEKLGLVMGEEQINGLLAVSDALERAKSTFEAIKNAVAAYFAPALEEALTKATEFGLALFDALKSGDPEEIKKVLTDIGAYIKDGIGAALPDVLDAGCKIVEEILSGIIETAPDIVDGAIEIIGTLCDSLYELLCDIGDVAPDIIETLADAITDALPDLVPAALDAITSFAEGLLDNVDELVDSAIEMVESLADGIMKAVPGLIKKAPVLVEKFATGITSASQKLLTSAIELVKKLGGFIINNLPAIIDAGKKIVDTLVNSMINMAGFMGEMVGKLVAKIKKVFETGDWKTIGKNIVNGIWNGITSLGTWIKDKAAGFANSIISGFKKGIESNSPSKKAAREVGAPLVQGIVKGIESEENTLYKAIQTVSGKLMTANTDMVESISARIETLQQEKTEKRNKALIEAELAGLEQQKKVLETMAAEYQTAFDKIMTSQTRLEDKLKAFGSLTETFKAGDVEFMQLSDIKTDIVALQKYGDALEKLKARGVSQEFIDQIISMNIDDALNYTDLLLSSTESHFNEYIQMWELKQMEAKRIAETFYSDQYETLTSGFTDKMLETLKTMPEDAVTVGKEIAAGVASGIKAGTSNAVKQAVKLAEKALAESKKALGIASPSKKFAYLGQMSAEGFSAGFDDRLKTVSDRLKGSVEKLTSSTVSSMVTTNNYATRTVSAPVTNNISLNVDSVETLNRIIERFSGERRHIRMGVVR